MNKSHSDKDLPLTYNKNKDLPLIPNSNKDLPIIFNKNLPLIPNSNKDLPINQEVINNIHQHTNDLQSIIDN
jgi:hypothetical protein